MSEIKEICQNDNVLKINDSPHYPRFEEIIDELTYSQILAMAKCGYEVAVELKGGVIDE